MRNGWGVGQLGEEVVCNCRLAEGSDEEEGREGGRTAGGTGARAAGAAEGVEVELDVPGHGLEVERAERGGAVIGEGEGELGVRLAGALERALDGEVGGGW